MAALGDAEQRAHAQLHHILTVQNLTFESGLVGGLGLAPGANIGTDAAIFEAVHGTAPDIAGQGKANPCALLLGAAQMLDHLGECEKAERLRAAIIATLEAKDSLTPDLGGTGNFPNIQNIGNEPVTDLPTPISQLDQLVADYNEDPRSMLEKWIRDSAGNYNDGDQTGMPPHPEGTLTDDALLSLFPVTRHFIRQALVQLEKLGVVVRERNKGATVRTMGSDEVRQIYEVR